jgi:hypothetical protein
VGGFIIHLLGKIPKVGEQIVFEDLEMTIKSADVKRPSVSKFQSNEVIGCRFIVPCPLEIPFGDHYLTQSFDKRVYVASMPNHL